MGLPGVHSSLKAGQATYKPLAGDGIQRQLHSHFRFRQWLSASVGLHYGDILGQKIQATWEHEQEPCRGDYVCNVQ